jgi:hypothetical protein
MPAASEDESIAGRDLRHFRKVKTVCSEDDLSRTWFEVVDGIARTFCFFADGQRQLTGLHYAGDVFGPDDGFRTASAQTVIDPVCSRVTKPDPCNEAAFFRISGYYWHALRKLCRLERAQRPAAQGAAAEFAPRRDFLFRPWKHFPPEAFTRTL